MKKKITIVLVLALCMVAKADFTFGAPKEVANINSSSRDLKPSVSADGLTLYFTSTRPGGFGAMDIWVTTRETTDDPWGEPMNLGSPVNSSALETGSISYDGLSFYFSSTRSRGSNADLWVTTRDTIHNEWGTPKNLGPTVNSSLDQCYISISSDELSLYFSSNRSGGYGAYDLWVTTRETIHDPWGTPVNLGPTVNSPTYDVDPSISSDGRMLFFASDRSGGYGSATDDIWVTSRETTDDPWGEPVNIGSPINSSAWEDYPNVSADGSTLFFRYSQSGRHGGDDIWQAPIIPIVDFNGDEIVDAADMCMMVDHWGTDNSTCDIGPMPWGDGIVDVEDLKVLTEYLFVEIFPPALVAYWKLNEVEGDVAYNSINDNQGILIGNPVWQPDSGHEGGALEFDGIDDYISTDFVLDPGNGSFSVFAWIKGGAPGQVIISQADVLADTPRGIKVVPGNTWLGLDTSSGTLMSGLKQTPYNKLLVSESVITDDQWHHIGLVLNALYSKRYLYMDGIEVASDAEPANTVSCENGLYIGSGQSLDSTSFFSGLIDDIHIYNQVIIP